MSQRLYNGVRLLGSGSCLRNVELIDDGALPMVACMAANGLQVDLDHFARMDVTLTQDMERYIEEAKVLTGHYTNLGSPAQVSDLLFKKLKLKQARRNMTPSGDRESVEDEVLTAIQHIHPVVPICLAYKEIEKLRGTYVRPIPKLAQRTMFGKWRMYPNFRNTSVPSGRLSCADPNLLAMPNRTERGREIRNGFITDEGWVYVSVDFSQIEVRIAAHSSGDQNLIRVYENEEDVYSDFAVSAFRLKDDRYKDADGWHYPHVSKTAHRFPSKTCILASIYDISAIGLQEKMPVICANCDLPSTTHTCRRFRPLWTEQKCQDIINNFYTRYPGIMEDRKKHHRIAMQKAYIYDMWGRILHVAAVRSVLPWVVSAALREVGNLPYQGGAQGLMKISMAKIMDELEALNMLEVAKPLLTVHDELVLEVREDVADDVAELIKFNFENCAILKVPIKAAVAKAPTWGSLPK